MGKFLRFNKPGSKNNFLGTSIFKVTKTYFQFFIDIFSSIRVLRINQTRQRSHADRPDSFAFILPVTNISYGNETKALEHIPCCNKTPEDKVTNNLYSKRCIHQPKKNKINSNSNNGAKPSNKKTAEGQSQYIRMIENIGGDCNQTRRITFGDCISSILVGFTPGIFFLVALVSYFSQELLPLSRDVYFTGKPAGLNMDLDLGLFLFLALLLIIAGICQLINGIVLIYISKFMKNHIFYTLYPHGRTLEVKVKKNWSFVNLLLGHLFPVLVPAIFMFIFFDMTNLDFTNALMLIFIIFLLLNKLDDNWYCIWEEHIKARHTAFFLRQIEDHSKMQSPMDMYSGFYYIKG